MICSHLVNASLLLGAVISYGLIYPLTDRRRGDWFPNNLEESNMKGLYGYKVFLSIALILGDGIYNFTKILICTVLNVHDRIKSKNNKNGKIRQIHILEFVSILFSNYDDDEDNNNNNNILYLTMRSYSYCNSDYTFIFQL